MILCFVIPSCSENLDPPRSMLVHILHTHSQHTLTSVTRVLLLFLRERLFFICISPFSPFHTLSTTTTLPSRPSPLGYSSFHSGPVVLENSKVPKDPMSFETQKKRTTKAIRKMHWTPRQSSKKAALALTVANPHSNPLGWEGKEPITFLNSAGKQQVNEYIRNLRNKVSVLGTR
jgi:hypothetical protein